MVLGVGKIIESRTNGRYSEGRIKVRDGRMVRAVTRKVFVRFQKRKQFLGIFLNEKLIMS